MKQLFIALLVMVGLAARSFAASSEEIDAITYGSKTYDDERQISYWGIVSLSLSDYNNGLGDAEFLKLVVRDKTKFITSDIPRDDIKKYFLTEFRRLFGDLTFHDLEEGRDNRLQQFLRDNPQLDFIKNPNLDIGDFHDAFKAAELARRKALYGGHAGALYCRVGVKRRTFPVLYEIKCTISGEEDLRYASWTEEKDIGFSTPEHIDKEIKQAITRMLEKKSSELKKIKKYRKK